jgi:hypothetical protein
LSATDGAESARTSSRDDLSLFGPLVFWIGILIIGAILAVASAYLAQLGPGITGYMKNTADYLIYLPGGLVLPLIASLWIGIRAGRVSKKPRVVFKVGLTNAIYVLIVYLIAITVIYLVVWYTSPSTLSKITLNVFIQYLVAAPAAIMIILVPLLSTLSAIRRA